MDAALLCEVSCSQSAILAVNELYGVETLPSKQVAKLLGKITPQSSNKSTFSPIFSLIFSKNTLNSSFYKQMAA